VGVKARPGRTGAVALLAILLTLAGCGRSEVPSSDAGDSASRPGGADVAAPAGKPPADGPGATLRLTGFYSYDGPFTGQFICYHDADGYFELEGQEPYLIDITVKKMREGTFTVYPQDPDSGFSKSDPGAPVIDVRRLDPPTDPNPPILSQNGGHITFANGGDNGTLSVDYVNIANESQTVHVELRWQNCPAG
jgi:hypothetical protein